MDAKRPTILSLAHAPRIVRANTNPTQFIVLADLDGLRVITRHWDTNLRATVPCECVKPCESRRSDHFIAGLSWYSPDTWEQAVLHFSEGAWIRLQNELQVKKLPLKGIWGRWQRTSSAPNAGVRVDVIGASNCTHPPVDIGYSLQRRLGLSLDFFGSAGDPPIPTVDAGMQTADKAMSLAEMKGHTEKAGSKKPRTLKPKVAKGVPRK